MEPELVSAAEAAVVLGVSKATVSRLIASGALPGGSVGRRKVVPVAALRAFVDHLMADFDVTRLARCVRAPRH